MRRLIPFYGLVLLTLLVLGGWGWNAHRFINRSVVYHLPGSMALFIQDSSFLALHSIDADQRRISGDTTFYGETPRHYLDIDDYPNFQSLSRNLDSLIVIYGWERVKQNGTNPWATLWTLDSLTNQLSRGDWATATLTASDLGHYVGDPHQPLHATVNYNGQFTGNTGIHSRYETTMLSSTYYLNSLFITPESVQYVADPTEFIFAYILHSNSLVDSILQADNYAKIASGWDGSGPVPPAYYNALWDRTRTITLDQMQRGTKNIADLWYTAWVDAGLITPSGVLPAKTTPADFELNQNYPNPFNPTTTISYRLQVGGTVLLRVYSMTGEDVAVLVNELQSAGEHSVTFDAGDLPSGTYFYRLQLGKFAQTKKLVVLR
ncbi:MAG TPA: T9SS type A sorting domain-containing protein [Bacteroidota bacterium]